MKKTFLVLLGLFGLFAVGLAGLSWWGGDGAPEVEDGSVLVVDLGGTIREVETEPLVPFFDSGGMPLRHVVAGIDRASRDDRIAGLLIRTGNVSLSFAQTQELRRALMRFRRTERPAVAVAEHLSGSQYYLASACEKVFVVPVGGVGLYGLSASPIFLRGTLDKLDVVPDFIHIGDYKSAAEIFTHTGMSEANRRATDALLDSIFDQMISGIAEGRGMEPTAVRSLVDEGPFEAEQALGAGLVDGLAYSDEWDQLFEFFEGIPEDEVPTVEFADYWGAPLPGEPEPLERTVALIYAVGNIHSGPSNDDAMGDSPSIGSDTLVEQLREARLDEDVEAIVLRIDSGGGSALASDVIWREVDLASDAKPFVVSMGGVAASGGYYIAAAADEIFAEAGTITGSIGVLGGKFNLRGLYDKLGMTRETLTRGRYADLYTEYRSWSDDERKKVRDSMEFVYWTFVDRVSAGRDHDREAVHEVAQGRVWMGREALDLGLVDHLGGLREAIARAKGLIDVEPEDLVKLDIFPRKRDLWERFADGDLFGTMMRSAVETELARQVRGTPLESWLRERTMIEDLSPGDALAVLPLEVEIR